MWLKIIHTDGDTELYNLDAYEKVILSPEADDDNFPYVQMLGYRMRDAGLTKLAEFRRLKDAEKAINDIARWIDEGMALAVLEVP